MEEKKKGKVGEITVLIIVMIILGFIGGYFFGKELSGKTTSKVTTTKSAQKESINVDDAELLKAFDKLQFSGYSSAPADENNSYYGYFYNSSKVKSSEVDDKVKLIIAINNIYNNDYTTFENKKIDYKTVNNKVKEIFGEELNSKNITINIGVGYQVKYNSTSDSYVLSANTMGLTFMQYNLTKIMSAYKQGDKLIVTNKVGFFATSSLEKNTTGEYTGYLYKETDGIKLNDKSTDAATFFNLKEKIAKVAIKDYNSFKLDDYLDKLDSYKWTFTKNASGNYVFTSVEKID